MDETDLNQESSIASLDDEDSVSVDGSDTSDAMVNLVDIPYSTLESREDDTVAYEVNEFFHTLCSYLCTLLNVSVNSSCISKNGRLVDS